MTPPLGSNRWKKCLGSTRVKVTLQADYHFIFKIKFERVKKFEILRFFTTVLRDD